ncbi:MAG: hypothetical protein DI626_01135 [Micavibrio aeruginosavorus]|uniref:Uncharacterized protein n=1 Tax=Micavibrio aeruginosavorus TaxID=349221 RepID=A0A2W5A5E3_9BACT|nr:MAG: hypothetical protein DI626_01135 [Micavibrio aeruginosavorus]
MSVLKKLVNLFTGAAKQEQKETVSEFVELPFMVLETIANHLPAGKKVNQPFACAERWDDMAALLRNTPPGRADRETIDMLAQNITLIASQIRIQDVYGDIKIQRKPIDTITKNRFSFHVIAADHQAVQEDLPNVTRFQPKSGLPIPEELLPFERNIQNARKITDFIEKFDKIILCYVFDAGQKKEVPKGHSVGMSRSGRHHH